MGNLRHKGAKKLAQVHMVRKKQGWNSNPCSFHIMLGVGRANRQMHGKVLFSHQGLFSPGLY